MPAAAETFSLGMPAEIGRIEKELKKLWADGEGALTRASLINLAVYSEKKGSAAENTRLMSQVTESHACRAIVIEADTHAADNQAQAWISAHCHVSRAGSRQICSEQISFQLSGPCAKLLTSIVFSHLDSDLPFFLWWQAELRPPLDPELWTWVDHLIYDSHDWRDFGGQMNLVDTARQEAEQRIVLCDLNWTRLDKIRAAVAQFFDHPTSHHHFAKIEKITILHAPEYRSTALLLAGWLASQLKWRDGKKTYDGNLQFINSTNKTVEIALRAEAGEPIGEIAITSGSTVFAVKHSSGADLLEVTRHDGDEQRMDQLMPAGKNDVGALLKDELMRGGPHSVYLRVIGLIRNVL